MVIKTCLSLALGVIFIMTLASSSVRAQEATPALESSTSSEILIQNPDAPQVFEKPQLESEIQDVQKTYRSHLEQYRVAHRKYQIAKEQYFKLNTLASLEEAVTSTREAMRLRDEVLIHYFKLLRLRLIDATGINLTQKDPALKDVERLITLLEGHKQKVEQSSDRYLVSTTAEQFVAAAPSIEAVAYKALSLLAVGKLQTVYDKSLTLHQEIGDNLSSGSADIKKSERDRALAEIKNELQDVRPLFDKGDDIINRDEGTFQRSSFSQVLQSLGGVYSGLAQALGHMNELLKL